jgi:hypothetical protein
MVYDQGMPTEQKRVIVLTKNRAAALLASEEYFPSPDRAEWFFTERGTVSESESIRAGEGKAQLLRLNRGQQNEEKIPMGLGLPFS